MSVKGVEQNATNEQIRTAYRKRALMFHPDRYKGPRVQLARDAFLRVADATEALENAEARREYDESLLRRAAAPEATPPEPMHMYSESETDGFRREFNAMFVFLSHTRDELREGRDVDNVLPFVMIGAVHILTELAMFITRNFPQLSAIILLITVLFTMTTTANQRQALIENFDWSRLGNQKKLAILEALILFYDNKRRN